VGSPAAKAALGAKMALDCAEQEQVSQRVADGRASKNDARPSKFSRRERM